MKCLKCEKVMETAFADTPHQPASGGELICSFHYGSRYDQCADLERPMLPLREGVLRCDNLVRCCNQIRAYICDDCFERHSDLFSGYRVKTVTKEEKVL